MPSCVSIVSMAPWSSARALRVARQEGGAACIEVRLLIARIAARRFARRPEIVGPPSCATAFSSGTTHCVPDAGRAEADARGHLRQRDGGRRGGGPAGAPRGLDPYVVAAISKPVRVLTASQGSQSGRRELIRALRALVRNGGWTWNDPPRRRHVLEALDMALL